MITAPLQQTMQVSKKYYHRADDRLPSIDLRKKRRLGESLIQGFLFVCGAFSILTTLGIVYELGKEALLFFRSPAVSLWEFLTGTQWQPHDRTNSASCPWSIPP